MVECFLHVLKKYIYDLFYVFTRKWLNLLYYVLWGWALQ